MCLPIMIDIKIYKWGSHYPSGVPPPTLFQKCQILHLWCDFAEIWNYNILKPQKNQIDINQ